MKTISPKRREMNRREKSRYDHFTDRAYQYVLDRAQRRLEPDCTDSQFESAIRAIIRDPDQFTILWEDKLPELFEEYKRRNGWTQDVIVSGPLTHEGIEQTAQLLVSIYQQDTLSHEALGS